MLLSGGGGSGSSRQLLGKQPVQDVQENPQRHTLLHTRFPLIVPGGRFDESYYWDTYWIVLGLQASNMVRAHDGNV